MYTKSSNGETFEEKQLLLSNTDYPAAYTCHVRDPKVWKENGRYYMILGGRRTDNHGAVMIYSSTDKRKWTLQKEMSTREPFGYMWECPDLFELEGKRFLLCCPQGLEAQQERYQNLYQSGYFVCDDFTLEDQKDYVCHPANFRELDYGFDFYAPQTFTDQQGRRILIGWAGMSEEADYGNDPIIKEGWQHSLTVPRLLSFSDGILRQYPVPELEQLRSRKLSLDSDFIESPAFDLCLTFGGSDQSVRLNDDLILTCQKGLVTLTFLNGTGCGRTSRCARLKQQDGHMENLRILKDTSLLEIYINDGELVFTTKYFPKNTNRTAVTVTGTVLDAQFWELRRMEVETDENEKKYSAGNR